MQNVHVVAVYLILGCFRWVHLQQLGPRNPYSIYIAGLSRIILFRTPAQYYLLIHSCWSVFEHHERKIGGVGRKQSLHPVRSHWYWVLISVFGLNPACWLLGNSFSRLQCWVLIDSGKILLVHCWLCHICVSYQYWMLFSCTCGSIWSCWRWSYSLAVIQFTRIEFMVDFLGS